MCTPEKYEKEKAKKERRETNRYIASVAPIFAAVLTVGASMPQYLYSDNLNALFGVIAIIVGLGLSVFPALPRDFRKISKTWTYRIWFVVIFSLGYFPAVQKETEDLKVQERICALEQKTWVDNECIEKNK